MIKVCDLSFGYKNHKILGGISLTLEAGELCSVIGVNGSGKTTLIKLLGRLLTPDSGSIEVDERPISDYTPKDLAKKISRLSQSRDIPDVSVSDLIASGRYPYLGFSGRLGDSDISVLNSATEMTNTSSLLGRNVRKLSGGERQRVYFAMLLAQDTPYVLLDEPATYLDAASRFELYRLIGRMKEMGKGILSVSHDLPYAIKHSDKILILDGGNAVFYGPPSDHNALEIIEKVFGVRCVESIVDGEKEYFIKETITPFKGD